MAARHSPLDSPPSNDLENYCDVSPSRPLSGTGASRQARRLQLRNAGFRGGAVPTRKVTPKSTSTSASGPGMSDAENVSPAGAKSRELSVSKRQSSGVLQEISNSTLTKPKKSRPRMSSARLFAAMNNDHAIVGEEAPQSPPPPKTSIRPKAVKTRAKMSQKRRSTSAGMTQYIAYLEEELASANSKLAAVNSPTVTREQSTKVRNLNAETRHLQQELDEWDAKYERRVQEALDEYAENENHLKNRIRALEDEAAEARVRLQELEMQVEVADEKTAATETANVNLEKRLEIMSELLAASPTKIDLHAETPGRRRRQQRPQSMLPRFPTASSLVCSPERQSFTQPASPLLSFTNNSPGLSFSPTHEPLRLDYSPNVSDAEHTDAESVFSDALGTADSVTSVETSEAPPSFNPWSMPPPRERRPKARMRKFNGSMGPKPLILPSTCDGYPPASAPALERSETTPAFFPDPKSATDDDELDLAISGRRRASTTAGEIRMSSRGSPPSFLDALQPDEGDESVMSVLTPHVDQSRDVSHDHSTVGSKVGRNLMEELCAMSSNESGESVDETEPFIPESVMEPDTGPATSDEPETAFIPPLRENGSPESSLVATSSSASAATHRRSGSRSTAHNPNLSMLDRLRLLFSDLWRSPVTLARHLVQTAQARMRLPSPLLNAQWWLVGLLIGPMARRRLLSQQQHCADSDCEHTPLLPDQNREQEALAYGSLHPTPTSSPTRKGSLTGKGKKRVPSKTRCTHALPQQRRKHSALMWLKFSLTLAFAVGAAFKDGPGSLLKAGGCGCWVEGERERERASKRLAAAA